MTAAPSVLPGEAGPAAWPAWRGVRPGVALLAVYLLLTLLVLGGSPLVALDSAVLRWDPAARWPALRPVLDAWVLLGQRAACLAIAVCWLGVRALRTRDLRPLGVLAVGTLLVNVTVGGVKEVVGRLGPLQLGPEALLPGAASLFTDGTIFPSGHTANAVVTWGLLAGLATRHRRLGAVLAAGVAGSVGLTTVYLGTHWVSDVLAGWAAGGLVLLAVPRCTALAARALRWVPDRSGYPGVRRHRPGHHRGTRRA